MLLNILLKKSLKPCDKRKVIKDLQTDRLKDISKLYRLLGLSRSSLQYRSVKNDDWVVKRLETLSNQYPMEGFWKYYGRINNTGDIVNHKRLHRVL